MTTPTLSVILPTHNRPDQLERAARSVLTQQLTDIELVIVDDASTDDTPAMTERLADDPRVTVIRTESSVGPGGARNRGIGAARGELIGFCDDDDTWLPGAAGILAGHLEANDHLGAVSSWHRVVHDHLGRTVDFRGPLEFGAAELLWFNFVSLPFGVIRRSSFADDPAFDDSLPPCEDWDLWLRCAMARPIEVVPVVLYSYHQHGGSRVTTDGRAGSRSGRQRFLDKHRAVMSPACRTYHRAVIAGQSGGRDAMLKQLTASGGSDPTAAAFAATLLASTYASSTLGRRRRDPGLAARALCRLVARHDRNAAPPTAGPPA